MKKSELLEIIEKQQAEPMSKWRKGVRLYAYELVEQSDDDEITTETNFLNGAKDWNEYSWGGCSLIYDGDIAERLATPSELKRKDCGRLQPNSREQWLDTQARALYQANRIIKNIIRG